MGEGMDMKKVQCSHSSSRCKGCCQHYKPHKKVVMCCDSAYCPITMRHAECIPMIKKSGV